MKRKIALLLAGALLLTGCGGTTASTAGEANNSNETNSSNETSNSDAVLLFDRIDTNQFDESKKLTEIIDKREDGTEGKLELPITKKSFEESSFMVYDSAPLDWAEKIFTKEASGQYNLYHKDIFEEDKSSAYTNMSFSFYNFSDKSITIEDSMNKEWIKLSLGYDNLPSDDDKVIFEEMGQPSGAIMYEYLDDEGNTDGVKIVDTIYDYGDYAISITYDESYTLDEKGNAISACASAVYWEYLTKDTLREHLRYIAEDQACVIEGEKGKVEY